MGPRLKLTPLTKRTLEKRKRFERNAGGASRIFESYFGSGLEDSVHELSDVESARALGAKKRLRRIHCYPWVTVAASSVVVRDPHRGELKLNLSLETKMETKDR